MLNICNGTWLHHRKIQKHIPDTPFALYAGHNSLIIFRNSSSSARPKDKPLPWMKDASTKSKCFLRGASHTLLSSTFKLVNNAGLARADIVALVSQLAEDCTLFATLMFSGKNRPFSSLMALSLVTVSVFASLNSFQIFISN